MFCLFMDKTFDSVNSRTINLESGKLLRSAVKENSPHVHHWNSAINTFQSMKFVNKSNGKKTIPPCLKNWIITLKSFQYLWSKLQCNHFKFFLTRHVIQDPLECLFGSVRSHGIRNTKPDCYQFHCSLKTLLINNFTSIKSAGNCEHDESGGALDNLKQFVKSGLNLPKLPKSSLKNEFNFLIYNPIEIVYDIHVSPISDMTIGYVSGYLARSVLKEFKFCKLCKFELISIDKSNPLIRIRDFTKKSLMHPSKKFQQLIEQMLYMTNFILPKLNQDHIGQQLILMFESIDFPLYCPKHNLKIFIHQKLIYFYLREKYKSHFKRHRQTNF